MFRNIPPPLTDQHLSSNGECQIWHALSVAGITGPAWRGHARATLARPLRATVCSCGPTIAHPKYYHAIMPHGKPPPLPAELHPKPHHKNKNPKNITPKKKRYSFL